MNEYITVKEFAEAAGVSQQYIYKILNTILKPYTKTINKRKMIAKEGLKVVLKGNSTNDSTNSTFDCKPNSTAAEVETEKDFKPELQTAATGNSTGNSTENETVNRLISLLEKQLDEKTKQLEAKEKQLEIKDKQIQDLSKLLADALELTKGQQYIAVADKANQFNNNTAAASIVNEEVVNEEAIIEKKPSLFDRFKSWKKGNNG